jgi:tetratricopeptide (TPR) repeat protein
MNSAEQPSGARPKLRKYVRAVGPRLRLVLYLIFGLVALLGANSAYLASITFLEWVKGLTYQNYFYQFMFLAHLVLGLLLVLPFVVFGALHIKNAHNRPNRRAVRVGYLLFGISIALLVSGLALMRFDFFAIKDPRLRSPIYWIHVVTPLLAVWLYILHRLAGPRLKWRLGLGWAVAVAAVVMAMVVLHSQDPRKWNVAGPKEGQKYFLPSLARTATGNFIPARTMMLNEYCLQCHQDSYNSWFHSAHHFSSFNNSPYLFSVRETRQVSLKRDGNVRAARWCAGCHDVVPFFSGAFDNPRFDDVHDPTAQAGITCVACHSVTHINSTRGNADYTIEEPILYPFTFSSNAVLSFINRTLVKAKPEFHKKTFLKPFHKTAEFCSTCHKVSVPYELNKYKEFLRGQNHYDTYLLSGVSGHSARSFYYPEEAKQNCAACHMPLTPSSDFGARFNDPKATNQVLTVHNHLFPAANTGLAALRQDVLAEKAEREFLKGTLRVDIFGLKDGGTIDSPLTAPLRPKVPALKPGHRYLLEVVVRTLTLGHPFSQGTVDSNEIWVQSKVSSGSKVLGRSGGLGPHKEVDPWSHFVNVYMLDKDGNRIDRRNPQDIFTPLYNHQIPPGAGQVVHYEFSVPEDQREPLRFEVALNYRKFDTVYVNYFSDPNYTNGAPLRVTNELPIITMASDAVTFGVESAAGDAVRKTVDAAPSKIPEWQRWNDYGIGLLLEGERGSEKGELIQAAEAFEQVEKLGRADGPLNLARVFYKEGRLDNAVAALQRAAKFEPPAPRWTIAWLNGLAEKANGHLDKAIADFRSILEDQYPELEQRHFDFSKDYEVINELGQTYVERAKRERSSPAQYQQFLRLALEQFNHTLALDSENVAAHYNLALIHEALGDQKQALVHRQLHERYRPDDNATDRAISLARRTNKAADHAAQAIVLYPLQRPGAPGLSPESPATAAPKMSTADAGKTYPSSDHD